jgi:hypothetical protein
MNSPSWVKTRFKRGPPQLTYEYNYRHRQHNNRKKLPCLSLLLAGNVATETAETTETAQIHYAAILFSSLKIFLQNDCSHCQEFSR